MEFGEWLTLCPASHRSSVRNGVCACNEKTWSIVEGSVKCSYVRIVELFNPFATNRYKMCSILNEIILLCVCVCDDATIIYFECFVRVWITFSLCLSFHESAWK